MAFKTQACRGGIGIFYALVFAAIANGAWAQISPERTAYQRMQKGKWASAHQSLKKALSKDSVNAEAHFVYALFFLNKDNPDFQLDSAYRFANRALADYAVSTPRQKDRLARIPIDSGVLLAVRSAIDSIAFEQARRINTENGYIDFISRFSYALQKKEAIELRNEVAFLEALRINTTSSYSDYLKKYPESLRAKEVSQRYEQLLFTEHTKDGKLASYVKFIGEYPKTTFRETIEKKIFEVSTAAGGTGDYEKFLKDFPESKFRNRALNILYYLHREAGDRMPTQLLTDSLQRLDQLKQGYLVPFLKNGRYGFMNDQGQEIMPATFRNINPEYWCGNIQQDFLATSDGLFARSGIPLTRDSVSEATDLGFGFIKVRVGDCVSVVSKSGFAASEVCVEDVRLIARRFLAVRKNGQWGLLAFNGLMLLPYHYQDIFNIDNVIVLQRTGKKIVVKPESVYAVADKQPLDDKLVFDEVRTWGTGNLLVKSGVLEGVLSQNLEFIIPFDRHQLTKTSFGFIQAKENRLKIVGAGPQLEGETFDRVKDYGEWLELYKVPGLLLYQLSSGKMVDQNLDSVWLRNKIIFARKNDSLLLFGRSGRLASFHRSSPVRFINSRDTAVYFFVQEKNKKTVFEATTSRKLFTSEFEDIEHLSQSYFLFTRNKKKGILGGDGKPVLPAQYDIIVLTATGFVSLYKDKRFGLFDLNGGKLIKPVYERNLLPYSAEYFIAFKEGSYGLITRNEKPATNFEFDEIRFWTDTSALVRKNFYWSVYSLTSGKALVDRIRSYEVMTNTIETIVKIQRENYYGVMGTQRGLIIPPNFTEIINVGSDEKPLYFTEKRVEEAEIYVVIYYDHTGKFLRKQVYENEEYERIYCEDH